MLPPAGTIVFNTVGRPQYGFDVFSVDLHHPPPHAAADHRLTDGVSINFNAQFFDNHEEIENIVFVSERTGSPRFYLTRPGNKPQPLPFLPNSLFHDRPTIKNGTLYFVSTEEPLNPVFKSWSAVYSAAVINGGETVTKLTPHGIVDYSPAVSLTGKYIAVASYGSRRWGGDFTELRTEIVVFAESNPENRLVVSDQGGWPTWSQDSTIFFHRIAEDGWWSIFGSNYPTLIYPDYRIHPFE